MNHREPTIPSGDLGWVLSEQPTPRPAGRRRTVHSYRVHPDGVELDGRRVGWDQLAGVELLYETEHGVDGPRARCTGCLVRLADGDEVVIDGTAPDHDALISEVTYRSASAGGGGSGPAVQARVDGTPVQPQRSRQRRRAPRRSLRTLIVGGLRRLARLVLWLVRTAFWVGVGVAIGAYLWL